MLQSFSLTSTILFLLETTSKGVLISAPWALYNQKPSVIHTPPSKVSSWDAGNKEWLLRHRANSLSKATVIYLFDAILFPSLSLYGIEQKKCFLLSDWRSCYILDYHCFPPRRGSLLFWECTPSGASSGTKFHVSSLHYKHFINDKKKMKNRKITKINMMQHTEVVYLCCIPEIWHCTAWHLCLYTGETGIWWMEHSPNKKLAEW